jgi:acetoin utilization protein AcuB
MQPTGHEHHIPVLTLPVRQVMRRDFVTVPPTESLADAYQLMRFARLRHLLVEEHGYLVGILSYRDLQDILVSPATHRPAKASSDDPVTRAMRAKPYAITPDTRLCDAATRLCSLRLGCLPVVERTDVRPALVGIVTEVDLLLAAYQSS